VKNQQEVAVSAKDRLQGVESLLEKRGVRDVKFFFRPGLAEVPSSEVFEGATDFLEAYLSGRFTKVAKINDSVSV
jgi:hypothetical protein